MPKELGFLFSHFRTEYFDPEARPVCAYVCVRVRVCVRMRAREGLFFQSHVLNDAWSIDPLVVLLSQDTFWAGSQYADVLNDTGMSFHIFVFPPILLSSSLKSPFYSQMSRIWPVFYVIQRSQFTKGFHLQSHTTLPLAVSVRLSVTF